MQHTTTLIVLLYSLVAFSDVDSAFVGTSVYQQDKLIFKKQVRISNNLNTYRIDFLQFQPTLKKGPNFQVRLREPTVWFSFSRPLGGFINIRINDINLSELEPKENNLKLWKKKNEAGVDVFLNFNGVGMILSFFMKAGSPVLWATLASATTSIEKINSVSLSVFAVPSIVVSGKTTAIYQRVFFGPSDNFNQKNSIQEIPKRNNYLVLADEKFQPSSESKAAGPCFIAFNPKAAERISLNARNYYKVSLSFTMKPDFNIFSFGVWESEKKYSNQDFLKMLKENITHFTIDH